MRTICVCANCTNRSKDWIDVRVQAIIDGKVPDADRTFVNYWLKNGRLGENFRRKDIVFECFHNFIALSQWGNTVYNIMARLRAVQVIGSFGRCSSGP